MPETPTTKEPDAIVLDYDLDESPEKLWRALTDPVLVAAWLAPNDIAAAVGHRFSLSPAQEAPVDCEVLEADPERKLAYRWREANASGPALDSVVTFEITALPAGRSHLRLVHRQATLVGTGGMTGALRTPANDNRRYSIWMSLRSLPWAA